MKLQCPFCENGKLVATTIDFDSPLYNGETIVTKNLEAFKCDSCQEFFIDRKASDKIEADIIAKYPNYFKSNTLARRKTKL